MILCLLVDVYSYLSSLLQISEIIEYRSAAF
jgi:hypothetical protein